ncbi:MAG: methyltransferase family protein, partial [Caulobacteraceae bacterium]
MDHHLTIPENVLWTSYICWFAMELWVLSRDRRRFSGRTADRGSFFGFMIAIPVALAIAFNAAYRLPQLHIAFAQPALSWLGIVMVWGGMAFRLWAIVTLGAFFRTSVVVQEGHRLVTSGPYRWFRHPAYTGAIVTMVGLGLALANWMSLAAMAVLPTLAIAFRMRVE